MRMIISLAPYLTRKLRPDVFCKWLLAVSRDAIIRQEKRKRQTYEQWKAWPRERRIKTNLITTVSRKIHSLSQYVMYDYWNIIQMEIPSVLHCGWAWLNCNDVMPHISKFPMGIPKVDILRTPHSFRRLFQYQNRWKVWESVFVTPELIYWKMLDKCK